MTFWSVAIVGLFLPLFPFSMLFNMLLRHFESPLLRASLILAWPQLGVLLLSLMQGGPPGWAVVWAVSTSALYALRVVAVRDVFVWTSFLATSSLALLWVSAAGNTDHMMLAIYALAFSLPLVLLVFLADGLKQRYGGTYAGAVNSLAFALPRMSSLVVLVVLAVIATPVFPGFAVLLSMVTTTVSVFQEAALIVLAIWFAWSWAAARLLQALLVGDSEQQHVEDFSPLATGLYGIALAALLVLGIWLIGVLR